MKTLVFFLLSMQRKVAVWQDTIFTVILQSCALFVLSWFCVYLELCMYSPSAALLFLRHSASLSVFMFHTHFTYRWRSPPSSPLCTLSLLADLILFFWSSSLVLPCPVSFLPHLITWCSNARLSFNCSLLNLNRSAAHLSFLLCALLPCEHFVFLRLLVNLVNLAGQMAKSLGFISCNHQVWSTQKVSDLVRFVTASIGRSLQLDDTIQHDTTW